MNNLFRTINATAQWKVLIAIILATSLMYLAMINIEPGPNTMEARNLVAARECVEDGHWLMTTMNGAPRLRKPPLPTWIAALSMKAAGTTRSLLVGRLPNLGVMALMAVFVYIFARVWLSKSFAMTAAMAAVTSSIMWNIGKRATWDHFTICFAYGGIYLLLKALGRRGSIEGTLLPQGSLKAVLIATGLSGLLWGLSFLSKGPVTLYSVLLPFLLALIVTSVLTRSMKEQRWWPIAIVLIIAVTVGSSWWAAMNLLHPETMAILKSETQAWHTLHKKGFFYYFAFPLEVLPWTIPLVGSWILVFLKDKGGEKLVKGIKRKGLILSLLWFVFTIILLSVIPEKKMRYAAVAVMPASVLTAFFLSVIYDASKETLPKTLRFLKSLLTVQLAVFSVALTLACIYVVTIKGAPAYLLVPAALPAIGYLLVWKTKNTIDTFVIGSIILVALLTLTAALIDISILKPKSMHDAQGAARVVELTKDKTFYLFQGGERIIWILGQKSELLLYRKPESYPLYILVEDDHWERFIKWARKLKITHKEVSRFTYGRNGETYMLMEVDRAAQI
jgi:4-amino-4-deoxy-L-arabinose transferase-like glycosyltransferase